MTSTSTSKEPFCEESMDKITQLQRKLSYIELTVEESGTLVQKDEKRELRQKFGYCLECEGLPVKLYTSKKSVFNPFRRKKEPIAVSGECADGICFVCHPQRDPSLSPEQRRVYRLAMKSGSFRR